MTFKYIPIILLISLLSQQLNAAVMGGSMMGMPNHNLPAASESYSADMMDMSVHQHQQETVSKGGMDHSNSSDSMDCCDGECGYCLTGCHYVMTSGSLNIPSYLLALPVQLNPIEPLVQSPESPFRPPIAA